MDEESAQPFNAEDPEQDAYVSGNLLFLTYHEVGHLLLDQLLEVDQRNDRLAAETTADDISTWLLLPDPDEPDQDEEIWAAMEGWLSSSNLQTEASQNPHYPDDAERAARIACYLYGSNPQLYPELAEAFSNSISSVDCPQEFEALHTDLLSWFEEDLIPPAEAGGRVQVQYEDADADLADAREYLMQTRILEGAADDISEFVRLPNDVELVARSCGSGGAEFRYSPSEGRITACYEAVAWFMNDASSEEGERQQAAASGDEASDEMGSGGARVPRRPRPPPRPTR